MIRCLFALMLMATAVIAEPVAVPDGFDPFGGYVEEAEALYAYRRGTRDRDEQSIIIFRMRDRVIDTRLEGQIRQMMAQDCSADAQFVALGSAYHSICDAEYVAYTRVFDGQQGVCIVAVAIPWAALDAHELPLRQWIDAIQGCAPEEDWSAS